MKNKPCHAIQNGEGTIAPAITSHYFKAGVRDFLFALAIPHCCLIVEYDLKDWQRLLRQVEVRF